MRAYVAEKTEDGVSRGLRTGFDEGSLGEGEVTIRVAFSSVNYKDALATIPKGAVARISPLVPGIDLAGVVEEVSGPDAGVAVGDAVLAHGYDIGVAHHGGYAELARVPADWVVPLPAGLDARTAMALGTAGYTAALSVVQLEERGLAPDAGPVLVTGAAGGVGSTAVAMLARRGYEVVAASGRGEEEGDYLRGLGAADVISREDATGDPSRPLGKQRWAAAVDTVGGDILAGVLTQIRIGGGIAVCGNAGGIKLPTTVLPFILRGVALLGIDSVHTEIGRRREVWGRMADPEDLRPPGLEDSIAVQTDLDGLEGVLDAILKGQVRGRTVVEVG